jgi:cytochrome c oxidase subunit 3
MRPLASERGGAAGVLTAPRRHRRAGPGGPPPSPPDRGRGGGGGGDPISAGGAADELGPFALGLALIGIATLFAVLVAVWLFLRRREPGWSGASIPGGPAAAALSTALLLASSAAVELAARRAGRARSRWLIGGLALALAFLAAQARLWILAWSSGFVPRASGQAAVFFALTGLHALHVLGGVAFLSQRALRSRSASPRLAALYWHFMGLIWCLLFLLLYFVG